VDTPFHGLPVFGVNTSTAFSPTDTAVLSVGEPDDVTPLISLTIVILPAARAVNIL
jgi:hypothetical protein